MRLLLFSDLHLDAPASTSSAPSRDDVRAGFQRICELAGSLNVDAVCVAGNLFDQANAGADTADALRSGFAGISRIPVFIAPGSADCLSPGSLYRATEWSGNVHLFTEPHLTAKPLGPGVTLWGAAHVQPVHTVGFLGTGERRNPGVNLALFHGCERAEFDAQQPEGPITAPFYARDVRADGFAHALVGHLPLPRATDVYTYAGRPRPNDPDGPAQGGAVLLTVHSDGSVEQEWYDLFERAATIWVKSPAPPVAPLVPAVAPAVPAPAAAPVPPSPTDFFKTPGGWVADVVREEPLEVPDFPESTVRGQFVRSVLRSELSRDERRRILSMGLAALDGDTDFGEL